VETFHLPKEGVAVLLGVDAILDMARTSINVLGKLHRECGGGAVGRV
jgi:Na+/H+-dicarboxylate symporter